MCRSVASCAAEESYNPDGLIPRVIMAVKDAFPDVLVLADVALDPYSSTGQDGVIDEETGAVLNDMTVYQICKQVSWHGRRTACTGSLCRRPLKKKFFCCFFCSAAPPQAVNLARAGADMVCPSEMMDGRVTAIREALDMEGCVDTSILSYACKYASSLYGPFRDAVGSHIKQGGDKKTYQMDFANALEAEREAELGGRYTAVTFSRGCSPSSFRLIRKRGGPSVAIGPLYWKLFTSRLVVAFGCCAMQMCKRVPTC